MISISCEKCGGENDQQGFCNFCKNCMDKEYDRINRHIPHKKQIYSIKKGARSIIKNPHY